MLRLTDRRLMLALAVLWMALIFYLSNQSSLPVPSLFTAQDKLLHAGVYGALGTWLMLAVAERGKVLDFWQVAFVTLLVTAYGASDELHQSFVPGRSPDILDLAADVGGGLLVALATRLLHNRHL